jgi:hypothetical protein
MERLAGMKRSEAIQRIKANLKLRPETHDMALAFQDGKISWGKFCEVLAEEALLIAEDIGMQPPNITLEELIPNSGLKTDPNEYRHYYACWEPEDEQK